MRCTPYVDSCMIVIEPVKTTDPYGKMTCCCEDWITCSSAIVLLLWFSKPKRLCCAHPETLPRGHTVNWDNSHTLSIDHSSPGGHIKDKKRIILFSKQPSHLVLILSEVSKQQKNKCDIKTFSSYPITHLPWGLLVPLLMDFNTVTTGSVAPGTQLLPIAIEYQLSVRVYWCIKTLRYVLWSQMCQCLVWHSKCILQFKLRWEWKFCGFQGEVLLHSVSFWWLVLQWGLRR